MVIIMSAVFLTSFKAPLCTLRNISILVKDCWWLGCVKFLLNIAKTSIEYWCIEYYILRWTSFIVVSILSAKSKIFFQAQTTSYFISFICFLGLFVLPVAFGFPNGKEWYLKKKNSTRNYGITITIVNISLFPTGSCDGYTNITEPWRNRDFKSTSFLGFPKNDTDLVNRWWRFTGIGGDRVIAFCLGNNLGGTKQVLYIDVIYPTNESLTEVTGLAYSLYSGSCVNIREKVSVAYCPGGFYVYKPLTHRQSDMGYVTCEYTG